MNRRVSLKGFFFLSFLVFTLGGCTKEIVMPAPEIWPSRVTTSEGMRYEVWNLRLPGTKQDLKLKAAGTTTWIPLFDVANIRFTGPILEQYRPARVFLLRGGRLEGELFVDHIIEGTSDQGYWNMPMAQIEAIDMGSN
jgi:hypothetical protein